MKKLFTLVCGVLFAMFANAATLDIWRAKQQCEGW